MDPDGTMFFILNLIISFVLCLYTAAKIRQEDDDEYLLGFSPSQASGFLLYAVNMWAFSTYTLPKFDLYPSVAMWALFIIVATFIPFSLGLAIDEKLTTITKLLSPIITVLNSTITLIILLPAQIVFKIFRLKAEDDVTQQDIMDMVEDAHEDEIHDDQKEMIENIFELDDTRAGEIMTHRTDVYALNGNHTCAEILDETMEQGFSRLPVYDGTIDTILGILYTKDLLKVIGDESKLNQPVKNFTRPAMFVPEACGARQLLVEFKKNHNQIAVVVDEYGGTSGIVTMEDILEEIVGNIQDEYDDEEEVCVKNEDGSYTCLASMYVDDMLSLFDMERENEDEEDFDSLGGLIIDKLARIPTQDDSPEIEYRGLILKVVQAGNRRIEKVKVSKKYSDLTA